MDDEIEKVIESEATRGAESFWEKFEPILEMSAALGAIWKKVDPDEKFTELREATELRMHTSRHQMLGYAQSYKFVSIELSTDRNVGFMGVRKCEANYWERRDRSIADRHEWLSRKRTGVAALPDRRYRP